MGRIADEYAQARRVYRTEGMMRLFTRVVAFVGYCLFQHRSYWLYFEPVPGYPDLSEADFLPRIDGLTWMAVPSNEEADELEAQGFEFRSLVSNARQRLDSGVVALCIFAGTELANMAWVATTQQAKDCMGEPPYRVDFANHETCWGGIWTSPKYRRLGLRRYGRFKLDEFLLGREVVRSRGVILKSNIAAIRSRPDHFPPPYAEGRLLTILWWKSWRERPLSVEEQEATRQTNG